MRALEKSVLDNEEMAQDMGHLMDMPECTRKGS